jgi:hypothetical protein
MQRMGVIRVPCWLFTTLPKSSVHSHKEAQKAQIQLAKSLVLLVPFCGAYTAALHKDYKPSVVGIEQFYYAPNREAYNLFFEQPTFVTDFGIREIVMYNKLNEHVMVSHAAWILAGAPEDLEARQGWHISHDASIPHWKLFWFD